MPLTPDGSVISWASNGMSLCQTKKSEIQPAPHVIHHQQGIPLLVGVKYPASARLQVD